MQQRDTRHHPTPVFTEQSARRLGPVRRLLARRPVVLDLLVIGCFAAWSLLTGVGADSMYVLHAYLGAERVLQMQVTALALTLLGSLALWWRRRRPVAVAAVMTVLATVALATNGATIGFELGLALALYAVAASHRPSLTWALCGAGTLAVLLGAWLLPLPPTVGAIMAGASSSDVPPVGSGRWPSELVQSAAWYQTVLPVLVTALAAVALGTSARTRQLHLARFVDAANALARDQEQRTRLVQVAERARIAREMHDVVAHSLTVMVALGGGAASALERAPREARVALDELVVTGRTALEDMRRVLGALEDDADAPRAPDVAVTSFAPQPTVADLPALLERFEAAGLAVAAVGLDDEALARLDSARQLALYRIVQESLTNVLRHAPGADEVRVAASRRGDELLLTVTSTGGPAPRADVGAGGRGLVGMRERASVLGGSLEAGPTADGWRVNATLPWEGRSA